MARKTTGLIALTFAVAWLAAGCWFSSPSALSAVRGATEDALDSESVHFELKVEVEGLSDPDDAEAANLAAHGAFDPENERALFVIQSFYGAMEMRVVDGLTYMRLEEDGDWMRFEDDELKFFEDIFMPLFDPYAVLEELGVDPSEVKQEGSGQVRGKKAEKYSVVVKPRDVDEDLEGFLPIAKDLSVEFWVADGLPVRVVFQSKGTAEDFDFEGGDPVTFTMTIDLFDYGKPVDVQAPPEDEIADVPDILGGTGAPLGDPFEGAKCYGDRIDECLGVNPEVDAMASPAELCTGPTARVCVVAVGNVRADIVKAIVEFHRDTAGIEVIVLPSVPLTAQDVKRTDSQVTEWTVYRRLQATFAITDRTPSTFVGITPIDIVPDDRKYAWMFGARFGQTATGHRHGVFSTFRMENVKPYSGQPITDDLVRLRASKYMGRYTALLFLHHPMGDDRALLNYRDMYGFSDLDGIGTSWPPLSARTCVGDIGIVCIVGDGSYDDRFFGDDLKKVVERLQKEGWPVELATAGLGYAPSKDWWGEEYVTDLRTTYASVLEANAKFSVVGVSDDSFMQAPSVTPHFEFFIPPTKVLTVSAGDAGGTVDTAPHRERLYRLIVRGILQVHFGMPLSPDESSLMWRDAKRPSDLDGKMIPPIPK